jgi:hypothetical protein
MIPKNTPITTHIQWGIPSPAIKTPFAAVKQADNNEKIRTDTEIEAEIRINHNNLNDPFNRTR